MNNPEHVEVRLPILQKLLALGWSRGQIICPSPDSDDSEWRVPNPPSEHSKRDAGHAFKGDPVDLAIFDSDEHVGDPDHIIAIFEFKAPNINVGKTQLKTYLGNEPAARYGYWTNGTNSTAVFKLADGSYETRDNAELPTPHDNLVLAGREPLTYKDLKHPTDRDLKASFAKILGTIAATDSISTRPEQRLNEMANLLIVKMESDKVGANHESRTLTFQVRDTPAETRDIINSLYRETKKTRTELFLESDPDTIQLTDDSIQMAVAELQGYTLKAVSPRALSTAFQIFRTNNLKIGDGQYFTPARVIEAGIPLLDITDEDKVIDPAGGTGGFVFEAYVSVSKMYEGDLGKQADARTWAHDKLFMVDRDSINVKLARALMVGVGDGSAHVYLGDSIRSQKWEDEFPILKHECMRDDSYTVVVTNPPFGKDLRVSARDGRIGGYTVCKHTPGGMKSDKYCSTELGIVFVERAYRLLKDGGRLGIVLPETYFFSKSYEWFREWLEERFILRGVLNIPMEAFQGFCRAKTNFYVLQKRGKPSLLTHVPEWFRDGKVWVSNAPTIGINKDGVELHRVDEAGNRLNEIDDVAIEDVTSLLDGKETPTAHFVSLGITELAGVPKYSDYGARDHFRKCVEASLDGFSWATIGELVESGALMVRNGHGSPSIDLRFGDVPYIKVSDLRAGLVNVNSTNMVPRAVAERHWRAKSSGLKAYDVITPSRACKNIGEPVVLLPDQTDVVLTKEVIVFRPDESANFDSFYLAWALDLQIVKEQWNRVIFMQTNREDVGNRYLEIEIPVAPTRESADEASAHYRRYFTELSTIRSEFESAKSSLTKLMLENS